VSAIPSFVSGHGLSRATETRRFNFSLPKAGAHPERSRTGKQPEKMHLLLSFRCAPLRPAAAWFGFLQPTPRISSWAILSRAAKCAALDCEGARLAVRGRCLSTTAKVGGQRMRSAPRKMHLCLSFRATDPQPIGYADGVAGQRNCPGLMPCT
jgi:hypothetical protein